MRAFWITILLQLAIKLTLGEQENLNKFSPGYHTVWLIPQFVNVTPLDESTLTIFVQVNPDMAIQFRQNEAVIYEKYLPKFTQMYRPVCYTFSWTLDGMSMFKNGEYVGYIRKDELLATNNVLVNTSGTSRMDFYDNYPTWAVSDETIWRRRKISLKKDTPVKTHLKRALKIGDFIIILSRKLANVTSFVRFEGSNSSFVPISFRIKTDNFKHYAIMESLLQGRIHTEHRFTDSLSWNYQTAIENYSIIFSCEKLGWRIYLNGLDTFFYYHQLPFDEVNQIIYHIESEEPSQSTDHLGVVDIIHGPEVL